MKLSILFLILCPSFLFGQTCTFAVNSNANFCTVLSSQCGYTCSNSSSLNVEISNLKNATLTFNGDVSLASLNITVQAASANIVIPSGVTVDIANDFTITGSTPQERFLTINGDMIVGGAIDITNSPVTLEGSGSITANEIKSNKSIDCDDDICPTALLPSTSDCSAGGSYCGSESVLPVVLSSFVGKASKSVVLLNWQTLTEENFDYFEVQRSVNGAAFETIGAVKGNGFTSEPQQYAFTDPSPRIGFNYYRLNAVDYDGTSELFQVISVEVKPDFSSVRIYPNPNNGDSFTLAIPENLQGGIFNLAVTDVNGNVLLEQQVAESTVQASFQSKLAPGIYFVSLETLNYTSTLRLLVN